MATSLNNISLNYKKLGEYEKAIDYYEQTVKLDETNGNLAGMAMTYNNIGMVTTVSEENMTGQ
ncbi:MAG: tetratricopeptide repeat protein [Marinilabiliales bacterium]|nr:tetratricopeptide repeat protein [Marinilabiliales bacterium]